MTQMKSEFYLCHPRLLIETIPNGFGDLCDDFQQILSLHLSKPA
jgi:hypothetical protein